MLLEIPYNKREVERKTLKAITFQKSKIAQIEHTLISKMQNSANSDSTLVQIPLLYIINVK